MTTILFYHFLALGRCFTHKFLSIFWEENFFCLALPAYQFIHIEHTEKFLFLFIFLFIDTEF